MRCEHDGGPRPLRPGRWAVAALAVVLAGVGGLATTRAASSEESAVARGRYLTHDVAMCVQCHTPRDEEGRLLASELFRGAPVPARPTIPGLEWALRAPNIAGLVGFTDEEVIQLLTAGRAESRARPRPPMPSYRLSPEDARAVVAYLRSLE